MLANRTLWATTGFLGLILIPLSAVTTLILGLAVTLSCGLLLAPISLIWLVLLCPLLFASWYCRESRVVREIVGFLILPWAILTNCFVVLMPSMGKVENRAWKLMLSDAWPFTWEFWLFSSGRLSEQTPGATALEDVMRRMERIPIMDRVLFIIRETGSIAELDSELLPVGR